MLFDRVTANRPFNTQEVINLNKELSISQNFHSNAIEGSSLTLSETELVVTAQIGCNKPLSHLNAAKDHDNAWRFMWDLKVITIIITIIKNT